MTHPFHPLHGRELEVVDVRSAWGEWRVYVSGEKGRLLRLPVSWTDWAEPDLFQLVSGGRSPLHIGELRRLVELIAGLREGGGCQVNGAASEKENSPGVGGRRVTDGGLNG